ncbi:MAG: hypothetical protein QG657_1093, partial [Acidobacteriota bacterium]|nr:hypothetical protein [Acidobacteriota bacterium]
SIDLTVQQGCILSGDRMMLEQVMENLLSNAIKFSPFGKKIEVTVATVATVTTVAAVEAKEGNPGNPHTGAGSIIKITVRDEGPGLTDEDKKRLFGKFQRLSAKPTGGETSTGLGLSIIQGLVSLHGGEIRVESEPGKGCVFSIDLPVSREQGTV